MSSSDVEDHVLPPGTNESWRAWLMTGVRRPPVDRRRVRGAHKGLKRMLAEGMTFSADRPYSWKEFSDALVRQSVGDAVRELPVEEAHAVKLAYFGGLSNHEIADRLGMSVAAVERKLHDAIGRISRHVERGRALGRRATGALVVWLTGRWLDEATQHMAQVGAVAAVAVAVAAGPLTAAGGSVSGAQHARLFSAPAVTAAVPSDTAPAVSRAHGGRAPAAAPSTGVAQAANVPALPVAPPAPVVELPALPVKAPAISVPAVKVPAVKAPVQLPLRS